MSDAVPALTINTAPGTIHDFGGFPREIYQVQYPAPGSCSVFPGADVPVVQLSIDATQHPQFHYEIGRRLAELRDEGVLILGSGNVVHNLRAYDQTGMADPLPWAERSRTGRVS